MSGIIVHRCPRRGREKGLARGLPAIVHPDERSSISKALQNGSKKFSLSQWSFKMAEPFSLFLRIAGGLSSGVG